LDLKGCVLSEQILLVLGRALRCGSHLISLNVENSGIRGRSLAILGWSLLFFFCEVILRPTLLFLFELKQLPHLN